MQHKIPQHRRTIGPYYLTHPQRICVLCRTFQMQIIAPEQKYQTTVRPNGTTNEKPATSYAKCMYIPFIMQEIKWWVKTHTQPPHIHYWYTIHTMYTHVRHNTDIQFPLHTQIWIPNTHNTPKHILHSCTHHTHTREGKRHTSHRLL